MSLFKCKHPFDYLMVEKSETKKLTDDGEFEIVVYYLRCSKCKKVLTKKHANPTRDFWDKKD